MNKSIECVISIVERGKNETLIETFKEYGCFPHLQFVANGTADSELLDLLGFGTAKRDVVLSIGEAQTVHSLMKEIRNRETIHLHTKGIVFTIGANGISALLAKTAYKIAKDTEEEEETMKEKKESLILVSFNQGYTDEIMTTAKKHGARGGTVFKANWADANQLEETYGVSLHKDKEVLAIVTDNENRKEIMNAIFENHGLNTKAEALLLSLPVNDKAVL